MRKLDRVDRRSVAIITALVALHVDDVQTALELVTVAHAIVIRGQRQTIEPDGVT